MIAIIAILAAILFPVLARARAKARQTGCLSNFKQVALGIAMYVTDADDTYPITESPSGMYYPLQNYPGYYAPPPLYWPYLVLPYIKNWDMYRCPSATSDAYGIFRTGSGYDYEANWAMCPHFGYNSVYLGTIWYPSGVVVGTPLAAIDKPSETVLGVDSYYISSNIYDVGHYCVDPPGLPSWPEGPRPAGTTGVSWYGGWDNPYPNGFCAFRHNEMANVAFVDGHAKAMTHGALRDSSIWDTN